MKFHLKWFTVEKDALDESILAAFDVDMTIFLADVFEGWSQLICFQIEIQTL
jgi:hypothetical protein